MKPMGVIIGAVMKATRGQADAKAVTKVVSGQDQGLIRFTGPAGGAVERRRLEGWSPCNG